MKRYSYKLLVFVVALLVLIPINDLNARLPISNPESKIQVGWLHRPYSDSIVPDEVPMSNLKAGVAKVDITPPIGTPLAGYGDREGPSTGIHDPLHAAVLIFDDGKRRAAIVSLDLIQVLQNSGEKMKKTIEEAAGISEDYIIINASHTHGSPWLREETVYKGPWNDEEPNYTQEVINKVAGAAKLAVDQLRPVSIGYGEGEIDFPISRRWLDEGGKCHGKLNPEGIKDNRVKILRIDDGNGVIPMVVVMHAVCHPNVFRGANTEITADFPGIAQDFVENAFEDKTTSIFLQGCCGDIRANMSHVTGAYGGARSGDAVDMTWCGYDLGAEVVQVATKLRVREWVENRNKEFKIVADADILRLEANESKIEDMNYRRDRIENGKLIVPIQVLRIGDIWLVGLPGEPVVEYGLKIEEKLKEMGKVFVIGYIPGDNGYIPVSHMIPEDGYEAEGPYTESSEEGIIKGVERLVASIK